MSSTRDSYFRKFAACNDHGAATSFTPQWAFEDFLNPSFDETPRFLFRVYDDESAGTTSEIFVTSQAKTFLAETREDLFQDDPLTAAEELFCHLRWDTSRHRRTNLVSWTSSFLFALQYAFYRFHTRRTHEYSDMSGVSILVVDTWALPRGAFVRDLEAIQCFKKYNQRLWYHYSLRMSKAGYNFGEYLSQGWLTVRGNAKKASLKQLIDAGLFDVCPYFESQDHWSHWAKRVVNIRQNISQWRMRWPIGPAEVRKAVALAQVCFGERFGQPVAVMLLAIQPAGGLPRAASAALSYIYNHELQDDVGVEEDNQVDDPSVPYEVQRYRSVVNSTRGLNFS